MQSNADDIKTRLLRRGYFRSRDKDCGCIIRSAIAENHTLQASIKALSKVIVATFACGVMSPT